MTRILGANAIRVLVIYLSIINSNFYLAVFITFKKLCRQNLGFDIRRLCVFIKENVFFYWQVQYEIGDNMKGYGEETSRGRRRHVRYRKFYLDLNN